MIMVAIGNFPIRSFGAPYIVAAIGTIHNGNMDLARQMIDAAAKCGCNAPKLYSWSKETIFSKSILDRNKDEEYTDFGVVGLENLIELFSLSENDHRTLGKYCMERAIDFLSSETEPPRVTMNPPRQELWKASLWLRVMPKDIHRVGDQDRGRDPIPMNTDKVPADSATLGCAGGGDAGRGRVERRSFRRFEFTQSVRNSLSR